MAVVCAGLLATQVAAGYGAQEPPLTFVAAFTSFRETGAHVYGYAVELWRRADGTVTGVLFKATGQPADFPATRLEQIEFEDRTGHLRFTAAWCGGQLTFDGRGDQDRVRGKLEYTNGDRRTRVETVELHRQRTNRRPIPESDILGLRNPTC